MFQFVKTVKTEVNSKEDKIFHQKKKRKRFKGYKI